MSELGHAVPKQLNVTPGYVVLILVPSATPSKFIVVSAKAVPTTNRNNADSQITYLANPRNMSTSSVETLRVLGWMPIRPDSLQWSCQVNEPQGFSLFRQ